MKNSTPTIPLDAAILRRRWSAFHSTSVPNFEQATRYVTAFSTDRIIRAVENTTADPINTSGDPGVVRAKVLAALLRGEE